MLFRSRILLALGIATMTTAGCAGAQATAPTGPGAPAAERLERMVRDRVESGRSSGMVAGLVLPDGRTKIVAAGAGLDAASVFEIGSITKALTGTLLADMVRRGEVALDDPVEAHLPRRVELPRRGKRQITLLDLATHTSGLPSLPDNLSPADPGNPYADYPLRRLYAFLARYELPRAIGAEYEYSNLGVGLLGHALAHRAGTSYERLIRQRVLAPLEMRHTGAGLTPAPVHDERGDVVAAWDLPPAFAAAGALRSRMSDMLEFAAAALRRPDNRIGRALAAAQAPRRRVAPDLRIGLNWHLLRHGGREIVWHNGGTGGSASFLGLDHSKRTAVVVLSNSVASVDDIGLRALDPSFPPEPADERKAVNVPAEVLERYVGVYRLAPGVTLTVTRAPKGLKARLTGQPAVAIYARSETEFFAKDVDASLTFERDATSAVTGLVLHQDGTDSPAPKIG